MLLLVGVFNLFGIGATSAATEGAFFEV